MPDPSPQPSLVDRFPALARLGRTSKEIPFVQQLESTECGVACLIMVLGHHGKIVTREEMRDVLTAGRDGTTARDLLNAARYHGMRGRGVKIGLNAAQHLQRAAILHWEFNHYVVFDRFQKKHVEILDPAVGRRSVPMSEFSRCFTGIALLLEPGEQFQPSTGAKPASDLGTILWQSGQWSRILVTSAFVQILGVALPLLTGVVVDRIVPRGDAHLLLVLGVGLVGIVGFTFFASLIRSWLLLEMRTVFDARLSIDFVEHLVGLTYSFFQRRSAGDLLMRLNSNIMVRQVLTSSVLSGILDGSLMIVYFVLLFFISTSMAGLVLLFAAVQSVVFAGTSRRRRELNTMMLARHARAQAYQVEMLAGMETLKATGTEIRAAEQWSNLFVDELNVSLDEGRLAGIVDATNATLRIAAPLAILCFGAHQVLSGTLTLGTMLALHAFSIGVFTPLSNLVSTGTQLQALGTHLERIEDVRRAPLEQSAPKIERLREFRGAITLERVTFRYGPLDPVVVDDASISIEPGQFVAIVGRSGSGKSTLASLMVGLYPPTSGRVLYDGVSISDLNLREIRSKLGIVTQRSYLFHGSIRSNIMMLDPDLPTDDMVQAAKLAQIHDEIMAMPMAYETLLADGGSSISGGQRQRISLARALINKPVVLLLDEATSALDAATEHDVQKALETLHCTRIVIAHRLSTIRHADHILVMDGGKIAERGTHAELMARNGIYAKLVSSQVEQNR